MNAISFCLYGDNPMHLSGMIRNLKLSESIYPGWKVFVFHDESLAHDRVKQMESSGAVMHNCKEWSHPKKFMRLRIVEIPGISRFIIRDADSRLNTREAKVVAEWIDSGFQFHVI